MNTGAIVGLILETVLYGGLGVYILFLFFKPESDKIFKIVPIVGVIFKYRITYLIIGIFALASATFSILRLLG